VSLASFAGLVGLETNKPMGSIRKFEEIVSWQEARSLNCYVRKLIDGKKFGNNFRLKNQIEGSAGSVMDNIAEGFDRGGNKEFVQFLYIAKGSCAELRSQSFRAIDSGYLNETEFNYIQEKCEKISFLINNLIQYLLKTDIKGLKFKR
jgi:four helix bundle protein